MDTPEIVALRNIAELVIKMNHDDEDLEEGDDGFCRDHLRDRDGERVSDPLCLKCRLLFAFEPLTASVILRDDV
jgi:hypothetical protein